MKEMEQMVKSRFESDLGVNINSLSFKTNSNSENEKRLKTEFKTKAEHIIVEVLANDIHDIVKIIQEEIFIDLQQKHFIIIDDLDKEWITTDIRYDLIGSMIEVIKEFQTFKGVKIIISLRDNLYQMIFSGTNHKGGQREKFKPLYVELVWSREELRELLNKRLYLVTDAHHDLKSAFENRNKRGTDGFSYMLERTFFRPRDVISFVNHAIENSNNKTHFTLDIIKKAEIDYSIDRLIALEDEWGENFGDIKQLFAFLNGKTDGFNVKNLREENFANILLNDKPENSFRGELLNWVIKWQNNELKFSDFAKNVIHLLYIFGAIGIKRNTESPTQFVFNKGISIDRNDIQENSKIYVHKAFYSVLKINTRALEPDRY